MRLTGSEGIGFRGASGLLGLGFAGIDRLVGAGWEDTILGMDAGWRWRLEGVVTYADGSKILEVRSFETLRGGSGADVFELFGGVLGIATVTLLGGDGDDRFEFGPGGSLVGTFDGQSGIDTIDASGFGAPIAVRLTGAGPTGYAGQVPELIDVGGFWGVESLVGAAGGAGGDVLAGGDTGASWELGVGSGWYMSAGAALLVFAGFEVIEGGSGGDRYRMTSAAGTTWVVGDRGGADTIDFSASPAGVRIDLDQAGEQTIAAGARLTLEGRFEDFVGSLFADEVSADPILVGRRLDGAAPATLPGDVLRVPVGSVVGEGIVSRPGYASIEAVGWERIEVEGSVAGGLADLRLTIVGPDRVVPGQAATFRLVVENRGPDVATRVSVLSIARGVDESGGGPEFWVELGTLGVGESASATVTVTPRRVGLVVLDAVAASDQAEPTGDDNFGSREVQVIEGEPAGPRVVDVRRLRMARGRTRVLVRFQGDLDAESAGDRHHYRLAISGPDGRLGTPDDAAVRIRAVRYRGPREGVVLVAWRRFRPLRPLLVVIGADGGPRDREGRGLVGAPVRWVARQRGGWGATVTGRGGRRWSAARDAGGVLGSGRRVQGWTRRLTASMIRSSVEAARGAGRL